MFKEFPKKRAFITGGASGLGKEFAALLLADGWTVGIADINPKHIAEAVTDFGRYQNRVFPFQLDVTKAGDVQRTADEFIKQFGGVDVLINSAGIASGGEFDLFSIENFNKVLDINYKGVFHSCKSFVPVLLSQQSGLIINIASAAAFASAPLMSSYNVSKAAVMSLTETLQAEYSQKGLRFALVMPTFFRSNLHNNILGVGETQDRAFDLLTQAKVDAAYIAKKALKKINCGSFYVVLPADGKIVWFIKRHFPALYIKIVGPLAEFRMKKKQP